MDERPDDGTDPTDGRGTAPDGGDVVGDGEADDLRTTTDRRVREDGTVVESVPTANDAETRDGHTTVGPDDGRNAPDRDRPTDDVADTPGETDDVGDVAGSGPEAGDSGAVFEASGAGAIDAAEAETDIDPKPVDAVTELFDDLSDVSPAASDAGAETDAATGTRAAASNPLGTDEVMSPEERTDELEVLLGDLTTVDIDGDTGATGAVHTRPTVLDPEVTDATGFMWLGEDIRVFPSDGGDPDVVFERYEEQRPEALIERPDGNGVSATVLSDGLADGPLDYPASPADDGWRAVARAPENVGATALFGRLEDGPSTVENDAVATEFAWSGENSGEADDVDSDDAAHGDVAPSPAEASPSPDTETATADPEALAFDSEDTAVSEPERDAGEETGGRDGPAAPTPAPRARAPDAAVVAETDVDAVFDHFAESAQVPPPDALGDLDPDEISEAGHGDERSQSPRWPEPDQEGDASTDRETRRPSDAGADGRGDSRGRPRSRDERAPRRRRDDRTRRPDAGDGDSDSDERASRGGVGTADGASAREPAPAAERDATASVSTRAAVLASEARRTLTPGDADGPGEADGTADTRREEQTDGTPTTVVERLLGAVRRLF